MKLCAVLFLTLVNYVQAWIPSSRLQRDSYPISYNLKFIPDIKNEVFDGEATILIQTKNSIENITLNSKSLRITEITLDQAIGDTIFHFDSEREFLFVRYKDRRYVDPGEHILNIKFRGSLEGGFGFYGRKVDNRTILGTKFSPIHAREAFPCYDEPNFKSIFNIRLVKPDESWTALSNMEEISQIKTPNGTAVDFRSTIPMSTYLLAWFMGDFEQDEIMYNGTGRSVSLRFFSSTGDDSERKEALEITRKAVEFFENYTSIPYPLSKLDSIEVPYYRSGGMEHWGMIAYREGLVMYHPNRYSSKLEHRIDATTLITHEVSHMWFGNLVSHEWYNDLWLTEGFARYLQYKASFSIIGEPFLNMLFQNNKFTYLFDRQCKDRYTTETAGYIRNLNDIGLKYGSTTYDQGGAILQMLEDVIGQKNFQKVVRKHLESHRYTYATTAEFINTVEDVVPRLNIRDFMMTYLFQKNLPLIKVSEDMEHYILHQEPFCENKKTSVFKNRWTVPIKYIINGNKTHGRVWFDRDMDNVTLAKKEKSSWILLNQGYTGLYRTLYSKEIYDSLREHFKELNVDDRGFLIEETFHLATYRNLSCDIPLQMLGEMQSVEDINYLTFEYARSSFFKFIRMNRFDEEVNDILKSYFMQIFETLYHNVTWTVDENESIDHRLLRQSVLESFCFNEVLYSGCEKDVKSITNQNLTMHDDIEYIYNSVNKNMKKNDTNNEVGDLLNDLGSESTDNCSVWIKSKLETNLGLITKIKVL